MVSYLSIVAAIVLVTVAAGLVRILCGPGEADRMMAAQLAGTGGVAVLLLLAAANTAWAIVDVAVLLAVLAAFASVAFVRDAPPAERETQHAVEGR
jgi:multicomponent Na+:H+ antiporter subunit F